MQTNDAPIAERLVRAAATGGFAGMAVIGGVLWFDVSSIGSMLQQSGGQLLANLFLGGGMVKGAVLGMAVGTTLLRPRRSTAVRPVVAAAPVTVRP